VLFALALLAPASAWYNCTWHHGGYTYDLYRAARWFQQGDYQDDGALTHLYSYSMNLCMPSHEPSCGDRGFGICQYTRGTRHFRMDLGYWSGAQPNWEMLDPSAAEKGIKLTFTNGRQCNNSRVFVPSTLTIVMPCHTEELPRHQFTVVENLPACNFQFTLPGHAGCPLHPLPEPAHPDVPHSYRATTEITISSHNETFWLNEIHDVRKNKVRNDQFLHPGGWITNVVDYNAHHRYSIVNGSQCQLHAISPTEKMESVFDMWREHRTRLRFRGILESRGVLCDVWEGWWTFQRDGNIYYEDATWFFALPHWRVVEDPLLHRRPVSAFLRSNYSRAHLRWPEMHALHWVEFQPHLDARSSREVDLQWEWNCPGGPPRPEPRPNQDGMSSGGVAGLSIFFLALGGACGVGGLWYYQKRTGGAGGYGTIGAAAGGTPAATGGQTYHSAPDE